MLLRKYISTLLMKLSIKISKDAFSEWEDHINQELQEIFNLPMLRDINFNTLADDYTENETINIRDMEIQIPKNFYNMLLSNFGELIENNPKIMVKRLSEFLEINIDKDTDIEENVINLVEFKKYLTKKAAEKKGFTIIKGDLDATKN